MRKKKERKSWHLHLLHWFPIALILVAMLFIYISGVYHYFTFHTLKEKHDLLLAFVKEHRVLAPLIYMVAFVLAVSLSLPLGDLFGIAGGFLFPFPWNFLMVVASATSGSCFLFLSVRLALKDVEKKRPEFLTKWFSHLQKDVWSYLLFLRFIPLFPFWLVNIAAAFFNVSFKTFLWTTFVGIIPISYLHVEIGKGLEKVFQKGESFSLENVFNPQMKIALILLGIFALVPLLVKKGIKK